MLQDTGKGKARILQTAHQGDHNLNTFTHLQKERSSSPYFPSYLNLPDCSNVSHGETSWMGKQSPCDPLTAAAPAWLEVLAVAPCSLSVVGKEGLWTVVTGLTPGHCHSQRLPGPASGGGPGVSRQPKAPTLGTNVPSVLVGRCGAKGLKSGQV